MERTIRVWSLLWPEGIAPRDYERALLLAQLTKDESEPAPKKQRRTRKPRLKVVESHDELTSKRKMTSEQAAKYLGVARSTINRYVFIGKLKPLETKLGPGGGHVFRTADVTALTQLAPPTEVPDAKEG